MVLFFGFCKGGVFINKCKWEIILFLISRVYDVLFIGYWIFNCEFLFIYWFDFGVM